MNETVGERNREAEAWVEDEQDHMLIFKARQTLLYFTLEGTFEWNQFNGTGMLETEIMHSMTEPSAIL